MHISIVERAVSSASTQWNNVSQFYLALTPSIHSPIPLDKNGGEFNRRLPSLFDTLTMTTYSILLLEQRFTSLFPPVFFGALFVYVLRAHISAWMKYETVDSYDRLQLKTSRNTNNGIVVACGWAFYHGHVDEWIRHSDAMRKLTIKATKRLCSPPKYKSLWKSATFQTNWMNIRCDFQFESQSLCRSQTKQFGLALTSSSSSSSNASIRSASIQFTLNFIIISYMWQVFDVVSRNSYTARLNVGRGKVWAEKWEFIILQKRWIVK